MADESSLQEDTLSKKPKKSRKKPTVSTAAEKEAETSGAPQPMKVGDKLWYRFNHLNLGVKVILLLIAIGIISELVKRL